MGGPTASVLLQHSLTNQQIAELEIWLRTLIDNRELTHPRWQQPSSWEWHFNVTNAKLLGLPDNIDLVEAPPMGVCSIDPAREEEDREQVIALLGYYPPQGLQIDAFCNREIDHLVLGHLALSLAERYSGIIDFHGAIAFPLSEQFTLDDYLNPSPEIFSAMSAYVQAMPGKVYERYYTTGRMTPFVSHMVDTTFMHAWLKNPHFHMIK